MSTTVHGYATAAGIYWYLGWRGIIPVEPADKGGVPKGFTGHDGIDVTRENLEWFVKSKPSHNIGLRLPDDVIGIDVDAYDGKPGAQTLAEAEKRWGKLPYSPRSTSRGDGVSGIRLYRVPPGTVLVDKLGFPARSLGGVEILQRHHRYAQVWPSRHAKTGRTYRWLDIEDQPCDPPHYPGDIPNLPAAWVEALRAAPPTLNDADLGDVEAYDTHRAVTQGEMSQRVAVKLGQGLAALYGGACRHDEIRDRVLGLLRCGKQGEPGVKQALQGLREAFAHVVGPDRPGGRKEALDEFNNMVTGDRVAKLLAQPDYDDWVHNLGEPPPDIDQHHPGEYQTDAKPSHDASVSVDDDGLTTWEPVDLGPWLNGQAEQPEPSVGIVRSDGLRLVYPGREHAVLGETESGKTWLALGCAAAELASGNHVVYIHYEEGNPASTVERLLLLGVDPAMLTGRLRFVAPARPARTEWITALLKPPPTLVVHDGVNEAMSLIGADIMFADGVAAFRRRLVVPFLRAGAATIACDHLPKERDGRSRDAYGSVHKGNVLDGARIVLENAAPFGRAMRGASHVFVTKDRPGQLRTHGRRSKLAGKTYMGTLVVDATGEPEFGMQFHAPREDDQPADNGPAVELTEVIYGVIAALPGRTVGSLRALFAELRKAGHQFRETKIRDAVDDLIATGRLTETPGKRGATGYKAVSTAAQESLL